MTHKTHPVAIGIDTGGTNTDAVVVDAVNRRVLACAKAPTTYYDYSIGIRQALAGTNHMPIRMTLKLREPISAVGAPASAYIPSAGKRLGTQTVVPRAAGVAAAVGAAMAGLSVRNTATICPTVNMRFRVHSEEGCFEFDTLEEAKAFVEQHLSEVIGQRACQFGMAAPAINVRFTDRTAEVLSEEGTEPIWLETRAVGQAVQQLAR